MSLLVKNPSNKALPFQSAIHALGGQVVSNCAFNFSSALTNVDTMIATARVVENVGVGAYLGALASLADRALVTTAGSILTVEARHQSILNLLSNATSLPQPFDVALTPGDVLSIADPFISGCKLGFSGTSSESLHTAPLIYVCTHLANPPLTVTNSIPLQTGTKLNFRSPVLNQTTSENVSHCLSTTDGLSNYTLAKQLSCKIVTGGSNAFIYQPMSGCMVPANVTGPMYVFITDDQTVMKSPSNMNGTTNSSTVVAGPALLFVDQPDFIGKQIRPGLNATGATTGDPTMAPTIPSTTSPVTGMSMCFHRTQLHDSVSQEQPQHFQCPRKLLRRR